MVPTLFSVQLAATNEADRIALEKGKELGTDRTQYSVLASLTSELGELAEEIAIANGHSYKETGADGIIGEAVDVISCVLDLILITVPDVHEGELVKILQRKTNKWLTKLREAS